MNFSESVAFFGSALFCLNIEASNVTTTTYPIFDAPHLIRQQITTLTNAVERAIGDVEAFHFDTAVLSLENALRDIGHPEYISTGNNMGPDEPFSSENYVTMRAGPEKDRACAALTLHILMMATTSSTISLKECPTVDLESDESRFSAKYDIAVFFARHFLEIVLSREAPTPELRKAFKDFFDRYPDEH